MVYEQVAVTHCAAPIQLIIVTLNIGLCINPFAKGLIKYGNSVGTWFYLKPLDHLLHC